MKTKIWTILFLLCVCFGCLAKEVIPFNTSAHHEYGESVNEQNYENDRLIKIIYPKTNVECLDNAIQTYIEQTKRSFMENNTSNTEDKAELNVDYQSYIKDNRYISIKLDTYMRILDEKQQVKTWVYDQTNDTMVQLHDLLDEDALDDVSEITKAYFKKQYPEECDTQNFAIFTAPAYDNFETFVLRKDAFVFYFAAGTLFDRGVYMELPYEQLQDHIRMEPEQVTAFVPYADVLNEPVKQIDPNKPMVALTFDDGPTKKYTTAILDALKEHQASATFFVLGSRAKDFPEILQRMVLEGNEVGNHTFSHKQLTTLSKENIEEEITATQESIHDVINRYPTIIRPPYGSKNDNVLSCAQGKKIVTWTIDTEDWRHKDAKKIVENVIKNVKDGDIILMHDLYPSTAEAAIILIPTLQDMGFQLVTISELYDYGKNDAGKIM